MQRKKKKREQGLVSDGFGVGVGECQSGYLFFFHSDAGTDVEMGRGCEPRAWEGRPVGRVCVNRESRGDSKAVFCLVCSLGSPDGSWWVVDDEVDDDR